MYNWSIDLKELGGNSKGATVWKLEQTINFGLNGTKLNKSLTKKYWKRLRLDPARKKFLKFLLWPKKS
jgi:hypothetical protein